MTRKILISIGMALFLLIAQFGTVVAAQEATQITGNVTGITVETDPITNETTIVIVLLDETGTEQTLRLDPQTAEDLLLVNVDDITGAVTVNEIPEGGIPVVIDPADVIAEEEAVEVDQHPVGSALADFFGEMLGVDYDTIMGAHEDGVGFGVIAQALWMTNRLEGDASTFEEILDAKVNGNYEFTMPDGTMVEAENWGQFKKAVLGTGNHENLGTVMSDRDDETIQGNPGQEHGQKNKEKNKEKHRERNNHRP